MPLSGIHRPTIPDWALHWIHGVWNLFRNDGDQEATLRVLPVVERVLRWYEPYIDDHGTLSDLSEWNLSTGPACSPVTDLR